MKQRKKFISKFAADYKALRTGGRKADSNYFKLRIAHKKIAYVNFLVKNVDQLVIVASLVHPALKFGLIDRFLLLAHWSDKEAIIIFTKRDLASAEWIRLAQEVYAQLSYNVYIVGNPPRKVADAATQSSLSKVVRFTPPELSSRDHHNKVTRGAHLDDVLQRSSDGNRPSSTSSFNAAENITVPLEKQCSQSHKNASGYGNQMKPQRGDKLFIKLREEVFAGKRSAVVGHSGVGKTALLTKIDKNYDGRVREVSLFTRRGRHTTTRVTRHECYFGGEVFDMPGLKELDFTDVTKRDLSRCYEEFAGFTNRCSFNNCLHDHEPHCAVRDAVRSGSIHPIRYRNYLQILGTLDKG
ncbi:hypothetical protein COTS27_01287 [Spirochaetota bacterium]|nr:hypothetical protein COTS27_01287 [Spirochaetota bacterium]